MSHVIVHDLKVLQDLLFNIPGGVETNLKRSWNIEQKNESQLWRPLAAKLDNLALPTQRHVIAPLIIFLLLYGGFIQGGK